jgi:hypothetical protein
MTVLHKSLAALVALVLVGGIVDVSVRAGDGSSGTGGDGSRASESAYAAQLLPVADAVFVAVEPEDAVTGQLSDETPDLAFPARDAYRQAGPDRQLRSAQRRLKALTPPAAFSADQAQLVASVAKLDQALVGFRRTAGARTYNKLLSVFDANTTTLEDGEGSWDTALADIFRRAHDHAPNDFDHAYPDRTSRELWLFNAGHACLQAEVSGLALNVDLRSKSGEQKVFGDASRILSRLGRQLAEIRRPTGADALPAQITSRLRIFHFTAALFLRMHREILAGDRAGVLQGINQLTQLVGSFSALGTAMGKYGSTLCQREIAEIGNVGSPAGSSGGNPST